MKNRNSDPKKQKSVCNTPKINKYSTDLGDVLSKSFYSENLSRYSDKYVKKSSRHL